MPSKQKDCGMDLIIRNGTVVNASGVSMADVGVNDGKIVFVGDLSESIGKEEVDASEKYVIPGGVDVHTHLEAPGAFGFTADDFETGTIAAAHGGTTCIVDFCRQGSGERLAEALQAWHSKAAGKAVVDYGFHIIITDPRTEVLGEIQDLPKHGVTSVKLFMAYKDSSMVSDATVIRVMHEARRAGVVVMIHAEHGDAVEYLQNRLVSQGCAEPRYHAASRPPVVEAEATNRAIALAEVTGASLYVVHVSCEESLEEVLRGKRRGVDVRAETCPQYLFTDVEQMDLAGVDVSKFVFTPPPRPKMNQAALWNALRSNDLHAISSDHSPWNLQLKAQAARRGFASIPNGAPGIEERMTLAFQGVVEGRLSLSTFVALTSTNPAQIFGLYPQKGTIETGSDADIVVWDPHAKRTISQSEMHHGVDHTIYEGIRVEGAPVTVIVRGEYVIRDKNFVGDRGHGRYLHRRI